MNPIQSTGASSAAQGLQGNQHHRKSMSQKVDDMESAIDSAVTNGLLTTDQATALKKELDDVKQKLSQTQGGSISQLSEADRKKIREELQDVRDQILSAVNNQQGSSSASGNSPTDLFSKIDANGDGKIDKNELLSFVDSLNNAQNSGQPQTYGQNGSLSITSISVTQIKVDVSA